MIISVIFAAKGVSMKGIQNEILFALFLMVMGAIIVFGLWYKTGESLFSTSYSEEVLQQNVENHEKALKGYYDDFKKNDGGFDAYEASILLAKAIEFTWRDCYNICKDERELFTNFFAQNPMEFNKNTDCSKQYPDSIPDINRIKTPVNVCYNNFADVGETTVTIWGLSANTEMCSNYKISGEDNKQWGNADCGGYFLPANPNKHYCNEFCDKGRWDADKIDWQAGKMEKGKTYSNIRIAYNPDTNYNPLTEAPQIIVKEISI